MARTKKVDTETTVQETVSEEITEVSAVENSNEAAESQDKPEQKDGQKIYIGVSVPGMKSGTVFTGKIPKVIDVDFVRELCVPINKLSETLKKKAVRTITKAHVKRRKLNLAMMKRILARKKQQKKLQAPQKKHRLLRIVKFLRRKKAK